MIFRHRRAMLVGSLVLVLVAAVFALPVFGELSNDNDFDDPSAEAVTARNAITDATGAFAAPSLVVLVRLGADVSSPAARERIRVVASALRYRGVARVVAYSPGGDRRLVSTRRALDVPAGVLQEGSGAARGRSSSSGWRAIRG